MERAARTTAYRTTPGRVRSTRLAFRNKHELLSLCISSSTRGRLASHACGSLRKPRSRRDRQARLGVVVR